MQLRKLTKYDLTWHIEACNSGFNVTGYIKGQSGRLQAWDYIKASKPNELKSELFHRPEYDVSQEKITRLVENIVREIYNAIEPFITN